MTTELFATCPECLQRIGVVDLGMAFKPFFRSHMQRGRRFACKNECGEISRERLERENECLIPISSSALLPSLQ